MATRSSIVVPKYRFSEEVESLDVEERFRICLERARQIAVDNGYAEILKRWNAPCVSDQGATEADLNRLESDLGVALPLDYRLFLSLCRYVKIDDSREIGGFDHDGLFVATRPFVSERHRAGVRYLVFADYWAYADGDQLMFDLTESDRPVVAYLHEHGPLYEDFAPTFSLALWRLIHESFDG